MAIINNSNGLKEKIISALKSAMVKIPTSIDSNNAAVYDEVPFISSDSKGKIVKFKSADKPKFEEIYSSDLNTGMEIIAEAISKEVLNYIVENVEVTFKERLDKLESDYNAFILSLNTVAAGLSVAPLTPVGTALTAAAMAGGGPTRTLTTTTVLKVKNESLSQIG